MDGTNIMMLECRGSLCFMDKAFFGGRIGCKGWGKKFESNKAFEFGILGFIYHTHAPTPPMRSMM
jgi:hypothetical protein